MIFAIIVLITALALASTAAWFSIVGLIAIFAASPIAIIIMAACLESAKLVTASWLYRNWDIAPLRLKAPLVTMTIIMMFITSMGIFGALSKSHIEQGAPVVANVAKIERFDQRIAREQKKIDDAEQIVLQLDQAVQKLIDYDRIRGPEGSIAVRQSQKEERETLTAMINESQAVIDSFIDEKFELESTVRAFEVEIGPIKYVADMVYGDSDKQTLEKAVRWLILIIVFVFDPFAVLLLIAANYSLVQVGLKKDPNEQRKEPEQELDPIVDEPELEPDYILPEEEIEEQVQETTEVTLEPTLVVETEYDKAKSNDEIKEAKGLRGIKLNNKGEM